MTTKKLILINIVLLCLIILTSVSLYLFNSYLKVPYDPFDDPREYERDAYGGTLLNVDEVPSNIINYTEQVISEYQQLLQNKKVENIKSSNIANILENNMYQIKYVIVDTKQNKIITIVLFNFTKNGTLEMVRADYRYMDNEQFITFNECLIDIPTFNFPIEDKIEIMSNTRKNPAASWNVGKKYRYDYLKEEPSPYEGYVRWEEHRDFTIRFNQ